MAQLKDLLVAGPSRFIGDVYADQISAKNVFSDWLPSITNTYSLGSESLKWKNLYVTTLNADGLNSDGNLSVGGNLVVVGTSELRGNTTIGVNNTSAARTHTIYGHVIVEPSKHNSSTTNSYNEGIRINRDSNGWANVIIGGTSGTVSGNGNGIWLIGAQATPNDATTAAGSITASNFYISYAQNGSSGAATRIQGHTAAGFSVRPRLYVNTDVPASDGYNFYVNGTSRFAIGTSDNASDKNFIIGSSGRRYLAFGGAGIQAYDASNAASTLYLNYNGGSLDVGSSTNGVVGTFYGLYDFKTANGFTYSGIGAGTDNTDRVVWFSHSQQIGRPVYDNDFKYNPSTNVLTVGSITGNAATATKFTSAQSITLTGAVTGTASSQAGWTISTTGKYLDLYEARGTTTTLNKAANYAKAGAMFHLVASSSTSATDNGKTPTDANILQMNWDNNGGYDSQFGIATAAARAYFRQQVSAKTAWREFAHIAAGTQTGSNSVPVYVNEVGSITEGSTYAGGTAITLNNVSKAANTASFYASTVGGSLGHILRGAGATSEPTWVRPKIFYGTCSTAAGTTQKDVVCAEYDALLVGDVVVVTFSVANSAAVGSITLNVNGTGAKPIKYMYNNSVSNIPGANYLLAQSYIFHYDGTNWVIDNMHYNTNSTYSAMSQAEAWTGTATSSRTVTAKSFKSYFDNLAGTGLSLTWNATDGIVLDHSNVITAKTAYAAIDTTASANGGTIKLTDIQYDAQGHITSSTDRTITLSQVLNTAGSINNTEDKIYLIGATSQATSAQTYSNSNTYIDKGKFFADASGSSIVNTKYFYGTAYAGNTYVGWIKIAEQNMNESNHYGWGIYEFNIGRSYNSPSPEAYTLRIHIGWSNASIAQLGGRAGSQIIKKFRIVKDNTNHKVWYEIFVDESASSRNTIYTRITSYCGAELTPINTIQTEDDSAFSIIATYDLINKSVFTVPVALSADSVAWSGITSPPETATRWPKWNEITQQGADSIDEGNSDFTDNTELFSSYASNNGFADSNAKGKVYRRDAIKLYNYIKTKAGASGSGFNINGYSLSATVNSGTAKALAYYSGANAISGSANATIVDGALNLYPNNGSYREGIRIYPTSNWATIVLGGNDLSTTSGTSTNSWSIQNNNGSFFINLNNSSSANRSRIYGNSSGWAIGNTGQHSGYDVTTSSLYVNGNATFSGWTNVIRCIGTAGTAGHVQIAEIKIVGQYGNQPIVIEFCRRGDNYSSIIYLKFNGTSNVDPTLGTFSVQGPAPAYIKKTATSTWKIWVTKTEGYDSIDILRCNIPLYMAGGMTVTWTTDVQSDSAVSGWTEANYGYKYDHFQAWIGRNNYNVSWYQGRAGAFLRLLTANGGYSTLWSVKTSNGSWDVGHYDYESGNDKYKDSLIFTYILDSDYNASANNIASQIGFTKNGRLWLKKGQNGGQYGTALPGSGIQGEIFFKT